jgi:hypothetical protein
MIGTRVTAEGMSAFDDPWQMPTHIRPRSLGGNSDRLVWKMAVSDLPASPDFVQSGRSHGVVAPIKPVHIDDYLQAVAGTQASWSISRV